MSRLVAEARGLYYRTQDPLAEPLAVLLELPASGVVNVLDPCAGAGIFMARLFERMAPHAERRGCEATLVSYGVEPNGDRARQARAVFTHFLRADFFHTRISKGRFQLAVLNPPYDADVASAQMEEAGQQRLEQRFLRRTTQLLAPDGVLVYIIPQAQLAPTARYLAAHYTNLRCWRYPDVAWAPPVEEEMGADGKPKPSVPLYHQFRQVLVFAARRRAAIAPAEPLVKQITGWAFAGADLAPIPLDPQELAHMVRWQVPADIAPVRRGQDRAAFPARAPAPASLPHPPGSPIPPPDATAGRKQRGGTEDASAADVPEDTGAIVFSDPSLDVEHLALRLDAARGGVWADGDYRAQRWPDMARLRLGMDRPLVHNHAAVSGIAR